MLRVKMLLNNELAIIDDGKVVIFNNIGKVINEDAELIPKYTNGMLNLPIISILSSNNKVEIALFENDTMKRYMTGVDAMSVAMRIQRNGRVLRLLRRDGKVDDTRYNQLLFLYQEGTPLDDKLQDLQVVEC